MSRFSGHSETILAHGAGSGVATVACVEASEPLSLILCSKEPWEVVHGAEVPIVAGPCHEPVLSGVEIDAVSIPLYLR